MKKYLNFINESNDNGILVICDLQKEFSKFIPQKMVESVMEYCNNFHKIKLKTFRKLKKLFKLFLIFNRI